MSHGSTPLVVPSLGPPPLPPLPPLPPAATAPAVAVAVSPIHQVNEIDQSLNEIGFPLLFDFGASSGGEAADFTNEYWEFLTEGQLCDSLTEV
jgi:hypothetical protein